MSYHDVNKLVARTAIYHKGRSYAPVFLCCGFWLKNATTQPVSFLRSLFLFFVFFRGVRAQHERTKETKRYINTEGYLRNADIELDSDDKEDDQDHSLLNVTLVAWYMLRSLVQS